MEAKALGEGGGGEGALGASAVVFYSRGIHCGVKVGKQRGALL